MTWLTSFQEVNHVFRSRDFEQGGGGRRDSAPFVGDSLLAQSGDGHFQRRRITSVLFRKPNLRRLETEIFLPAFGDALAQCALGQDGWHRCELQRLLRQAICKMSAALVGIDGIHDDQVIERYLLYTDKLGIGVNLEWVERDHRIVTDEILTYKSLFRDEFFAPSWRRREEIVAEFRAGRRPQDSLPVDLITLILLHQEHFDHWDLDLPLRETILFNGASASITLGVSHILTELCAWLAKHSEDRARLADRDFVRRAVLESIRLHPASPFVIRRALRDTELDSGRQISAGQHVVLDLLSASRDEKVFSPDPDSYNPHRAPIMNVRPIGLAFGGGPHTCIGMGLSIGEPGDIDEEGPQGLMVLIVRELLRRGVEPDADRPARWNDVNVRNEYAEFPVRFRAEYQEFVGGAL